MKINVKYIFLFTPLLNQKWSKIFLLLLLLVPLNLSFAINNEFNQLIEIADRYATNSNLIEEEIATAVINKINLKLSRKELDIRQWSFDDENVKQLLNALGEKDFAIRGVIANIYQQRLLWLISNGQADKIDFYYSKILIFRPDPSKDNNILREKILLQAKGDATKSFVKGRLQEIQYLNLYTFPLKIKLYFSGFYGRALLAIPVCLIIAMLLLVNFLFFYNPTKAKLQAKINQKFAKSKKNQKHSRQSVEKIYAGGQTTIDRPKETYLPKPDRATIEAVFNKGYTKTTHKDDEYTRLLSFFELSDRASEDEIKKAYRDRVKNLHPDKKFDSPNTNSDEFMEIKQAYNRIMEIRSSWFGQK